MVLDSGLHSQNVKTVEVQVAKQPSSMTALVSRTGRHQQRYHTGYRLVAGCIPYRYKFVDGCNGKEEPVLEVLMITSKSSSTSGRGLLFPKGGWETDETVQEAAVREALEEAGVRGDLQDDLGTWEFKSKRQQSDFNPEGLCRAHMFALEVREQLESWPEQHSRQRQWFSVPEAVKQCQIDWMRKALDKCVMFLATTRQGASTSTPVQSFV